MTAAIIAEIRKLDKKHPYIIEHLDRERPTRFLRLPEVVYRVGFSRGSIYSLMNENQFPKRMKP